MKPGNADSVCTGETEILDLSVGPLDLSLLGLNVRLDDCEGGPVQVCVSATASAGLLGSLLAGLGNNESVDITVSGDANATYQWFNKGGNKPQGVPFNVNEAFAVSGTFSSDKNGNVTGSLTVDPPSVDEFLATNHAANWVPVLKVSYTDVVLTDTTNGVSTAGDFNLDQSVVFTV